MESDRYEGTEPHQRYAGNLSGTKKTSAMGLASSKIRNTAIRSLPTKLLLLPMAGNK